MRINKLRIKPQTLLLCIIFAVLSTSTLVWSMTDRTPPAWDPSDHMSAAYDYFRYAATLDFTGLAKEFFIEPHYYAPLVHLVSAAVFLFAGASHVSGIVVNLLALALLLYSVNWIARKLYGDGSERFYAGALAALLAACYHFSAWLMHDAFLDFPLTAIVAASFASLINAGDFQERKKALIFGLCAGLGMLTKQTFAFFFVLPAVYVVVRVARTRSLKPCVNLLLAACVALAVAAVWYGPHLDDVIAIYNVNREGAINENEAPLFTLMSNAFYSHALLSAQLQVPFAALFIGGLIYSLFRRRKESLMLYLWLLSGIAMFTLVQNKDVRYTVPVTPAAAILSVCWLAEACRDGERRSAARWSKASRIFRATALFSIATWAFVSFFNAQWPAPGSGHYVDTPRFRWMVFARNYYGYDRRPAHDDWSVPAIVETVATEGTRGSEAAVEPSLARPTLGVAVNLPHLNPSSIGLYSRLLAPGREGAPLINVDYIVIDSALDRLDGCEYVLVRTGLDRAEWVGSTERRVEDFIKKNPQKMRKIASFPIPLDQAEAVIYECGGGKNE